MTYSVSTPGLRAGGRTIGGTAAGLDASRTELPAALRAIGDAAGCPEISGLSLDLARRWGRATDGLTRRATGLSRGLGQAAQAYDDADSRSAAQLRPDG